MAVLFSKVNLAADNGAETVFLCCGVAGYAKDVLKKVGKRRKNIGQKIKDQL